MGRVKGSQNKITKALKDMILGALEDAGGQAYLTEQSAANPVAFMGLVGKVLPLQVTGSDGGPIQHTVDAAKMSDAALREFAAAKLVGE